MLWNLIADTVELIDQNCHDQQQQITDFYSKIAATFPRIACLMQLYFNAISILDEVHEFVIYAEEDNNEMIINDDFVVRVQNIIKNKFYIYDKTYLPSNQIHQPTMEPTIIVHKEAVSAAWKWYQHHLNIATKLFTIDHSFSAKPIPMYSSISSPQKTLKQLIMLIDFNIFPLSALTDKHPITGQTYVY